MCEMKIINYIKQLNEFYSILDYKPLSSNAISLYGFLLHVANKTGWLREFRVANTTIMSKCKLNISALQRARMELINNGYIKYKKGSNQNEIPKYSLAILYFEQANAQVNEQADKQAREQPNAQAKGQADEYIITKLNLLFNYIYEEGSGKEIGLKQKDKEPLITLLKKLEMYCSTSEIYKFMQEERVLDEKIMFWALKEIYLSPYRVYLNNLKRDKFTLKYYKTKKYIMEKPEYRLEEVINYFIVCLHEEMEVNK